MRLLFTLERFRFLADHTIIREFSWIFQKLNISTCAWHFSNDRFVFGGAVVSLNRAKNEWTIHNADWRHARVLACALQFKIVNLSKTSSLPLLAVSLFLFYLCLLFRFSSFDSTHRLLSLSSSTRRLAYNNRLRVALIVISRSYRRQTLKSRN